MKKQYIINEAKQVKEYVEKHKRLPKTNTYSDGTIHSIFTTSSLFATLIQNWNRAGEDPIIVRVYNDKQMQDVINEKVEKADYLKMVSNFINFCRKNKRVPRYITTSKSKVKVSFELFTFCLAKIIVYHQANGRLPNTCIFNKADIQYSKGTSVPAKNNPSKSTSTCQNKVNLEKGCDAMGQNNSWYCGVCALQKVLYKFGINESQKQLAKVCGTTTSGTSHNGLKTGIAWVSKKHNVKLTVKEAYFSDYTLKQLKDMLCKPNVAIICHSLYKNQYGHYECWKSIDEKEKTIDVVNSLGSKCQLGCFCGYIEKRSYAKQKQYCNGVSQKSLIIVAKG